MRGHVRSDLGITDTQPIALTVARFTAQKDHATLIQAAGAVLARHPEVRFLFAGDGPLLDDCRAYAETSGVANAVGFLGQRDDVPDLLCAADFFVLPSRFEGLPLSILEAMAAGLPVVSTRVGGTDEVVVEGETGYLVAAGDADQLAGAIIEVVGALDKGASLGAAGRERFHNCFTAARMVSETMRVYGF